jgi:2-dehydro-3-deoxyphosphogluconate aldolase/(4S)-4-hydroxy-2-oxoglutarate aldolase
MSTMAELLHDPPIIPVVVIDDATAAEPLADALVDGGLPCAEVTLRTPGALDAIRAMAAQRGMLVGAGSVCTAAQVEQAVEAGARFVVSPGFSDGVLARCRELGVPALPGVATPTEIMRALDAAVDVVKVFPAAMLGGPDGVRSLVAPFPSLRVVPTGGIGASDLTAYLSSEAVLAVGGSWMVSPALIRAGRFDEIGRLTREAVTTAMGCRP